jgi:osmotically-inducible protein OsmY
MTSDDAVIRKVHGLLEREPRINLHRYPIRIGASGDVVVLEGEVESVAAKKLALELAGATGGVRGVVDRLRVVPSERKGDGAIRDLLSSFLLGAPELQSCAIRLDTKGRSEMLRDVRNGLSGQIELAIDDGVITLEGTVISLSHKRIAGVLAWWVPGCRDVVNALEIVPPEEDNDAEIVDALRLVLEMDPLVQAEQITAHCRDCVVTLEGYVRTDEERHRAEADAWSLFAVDKVINRIEVGR